MSKKEKKTEEKLLTKAVGDAEVAYLSDLSTLATKADATLSTVIQYSDWIVDPPTYDGNEITIVEVEQEPGTFKPMSDGSNIGASKAPTTTDTVQTLSWRGDEDASININATRRIIKHFILGNQTDKPLASQSSISVLQNEKANTEDIILRDIYEFSQWTITPPTYEDEPIQIVEYGNGYLPITNDSPIGNEIESVITGNTETLTWNNGAAAIDLTAVRTFSLKGYQLGNQSSKPLAPTSHVTDYSNPHHVTKEQVISAGSILSADIADGAIVASKILSASITSEKIGLVDETTGTIYTLAVDNGRLLVRPLTPPTPVVPRETTFHFNGSPDETYLIEGTLDQAKMIELGLYDGNEGAWIKQPTSAEIGSGVTSIGYFAFNECGLTSVTIPNSVTSIGENAFCWTSLESVIIPDSVTSIGAGAFSGCQTLTSVTIPDSVASIGEGAFVDCDGLMSITMSGKTKAIVQGMDNYSWSLPSGCTIHCTDGDITVE